jgi:AcrR family transcriptional regulator
MSEKAPAKPRLTSDERRASIVEVAVKLFAEKGFRGTTTREIAAAVGVTEPVLYEHFKTKRDLYSAIIENKSKEALQQLKALSDRYVQSQDDFGFFKDFGMQIVNWYISDPAFIRLLLFSNLEGHELKDLLHESGNVCFLIVGDHIRSRIEQGKIRPVDPQVAARAFFGMIAHYAMTALIFGFAPFSKPTDQVIGEMVEIFLRGLCKDQG